MNNKNGNNYMTINNNFNYTQIKYSNQRMQGNRIDKKTRHILAGVAQLLEPHPMHRNVVGLIPNQGTCLGYRFGPQLESVQEAVDYCSSLTSMSLSLSLHPLSSLSKINKCIIGQALKNSVFFKERKRKQDTYTCCKQETTGN